MMPFIRSITELRIITKGRDRLNRDKKSNRLDIKTEIIEPRKTEYDLFDKKEITLPNIPKSTRRKWIKSKKRLSRFFDSLDYNNQIQSSFDLTLLENYNKYDQNDVA